MKPRYVSNQIRKAIGDTGFDYRVRVWRDGEVWVMPAYGSLIRCNVLLDRLTAAGYKTAMNGKPGTAGQYIINVE